MATRTRAFWVGAFVLTGTLLAVMAWGLGPAWFAVVLTLWAPLVALARVRMGVHFLSDVIVGMLLGIAGGLLALTLQPLLVALVPWVFYR